MSSPCLRASCGFLASGLVSIRPDPRQARPKTGAQSVCPGACRRLRSPWSPRSGRQSGLAHTRRSSRLRPRGAACQAFARMEGQPVKRISALRRLDIPSGSRQMGGEPHFLPSGPSRRRTVNNNESSAMQVGMVRDGRIRRLPITVARGLPQAPPAKRAEHLRLGASREWQRTSGRPSSPSSIESDGLRSSCAGHRADHPAPDCRPLRADAMSWALGRAWRTAPAPAVEPLRRPAGAPRSRAARRRERRARRSGRRRGRGLGFQSERRAGPPRGGAIAPRSRASRSRQVQRRIVRPDSTCLGSKRCMACLSRRLIDVRHAKSDWRPVTVLKFLQRGLGRAIPSTRPKLAVIVAAVART